jgi:hypothetical protein
MSTIEIKEAIHRKIDALENIGELIDINQSLDWYLIDKLSTEEKMVLNRMESLVPILKEGKGVKHEEVQKEMKAWIRK